MIGDPGITSSLGIDVVKPCKTPKSESFRETKDAFKIANITNVNFTNITNIIFPILGKPSNSKTDEFLEKFQTAFAPPPPHFRKVMLQIF